MHTNATVGIHVVVDTSRHSHYWELTVCFSRASGHTEGPLAANQYLRLHQHQAIMREDLLFTITHAGLCLNACVPAACECLLSVCTVHNCYECVYTRLLLECVCLFLMSLIIGHRPDSHQVLSWLVISSAPHRQISYLNVCVCVCVCMVTLIKILPACLPVLMIIWNTTYTDSHSITHTTLFQPFPSHAQTHTRRNGPWWLP